MDTGVMKGSFSQISLDIVREFSDEAPKCKLCNTKFLWVYDKRFGAKFCSESCRRKYEHHVLDR